MSLQENLLGEWQGFRMTMNLPLKFLRCSARHSAPQCSGAGSSQENPDAKKEFGVVANHLGFQVFCCERRSGCSDSMAFQHASKLIEHDLTIMVILGMVAMFCQATRTKSRPPPPSRWQVVHSSLHIPELCTNGVTKAFL